MGLFYLKQGDTRPVLVVTLRDPEDDAGVRSPHNLTGATAFKLRIELEKGEVFERDMVPDADLTTGKVSYTWAAGDWSSNPALKVGHFEMRYRVSGPGAAVLTFPNGESPDEIRIS